MSKSEAELVHRNRAEAMAQWAQLAAAIPEVGEDDTDDAMDRIALQLFSANTLDDLNAPWSGKDVGSLLNVPIRVEALKRGESEFKGGPGFYLVVIGTRQDTGEAVTLTTGSVTAMAQLVKAHALGKIPCTIIAREAERPTRAGYRPQHLVFVTE